MARNLVEHARRHVIAYLALVVALLSMGGAAYAKFTIPNGSVGERQIQNHVIDPVKWDTAYVSGFVRKWATIAPSGRCCQPRPADRPSASARASTSSPGVTRSLAGVPRWPRSSEARRPARRRAQRVRLVPPAPPAPPVRPTSPASRRPMPRRGSSSAAASPRSWPCRRSARALRPISRSRWASSAVPVPAPASSTRRPCRRGPGGSRSHVKCPALAGLFACQSDGT
jgi:hypothetical protein